MEKDEQTFRFGCLRRASCAATEARSSRSWRSWWRFFWWCASCITSSSNRPQTAAANRGGGFRRKPGRQRRGGPARGGCRGDCEIGRHYGADSRAGNDHAARHRDRQDANQRHTAKNPVQGRATRQSRATPSPSSIRARTRRHSPRWRAICGATRHCWRTPAWI